MKVTLIDSMGDDLRVVNSARVSFNKESDWEYSNIVLDDPVDPVGIISMDHGLSEQDQKLIKYLAKHNHWTPFSHVQITMREKVPIFVARQRFKHMVGFTYNEVSRRYVDDSPEFFVPSVWRSKPSGSIKQGSGDDVITTVPHKTGVIDRGLKHPTFLAAQAYQYCEWIYNEMIQAGVAPEQARMVLPQSMFTEYYVTGSLAAWARAYKLRSDPHAQKEIQELASMWNDVISSIKELEHSWKALTE